MSKPRNPRYFPHMKVRGARRRAVAPYQRMTGAVERLADTFVAFDQVLATFPTIRITNAEEASA